MKRKASLLPSGVVDYQQEMILQTSERQPDMTQGTIFFVGTATVMLRYGGFTILTDPNFLHKGERVHLGYGLRSERLTEPAMEIEQLPMLDYILLSHFHEDHFDRVAMRKLDKMLPIVTNPSAAQVLKNKGFIRTYGIGTWQTFSVYKGDIAVRMTALPAKHAPGPLKFLLPPVMGTMLEFQSPVDRTRFHLYISGDTILDKQLQEIPRHFPMIDLALLHLGGTTVMGVLLTMDGRQGVQALKIIAPHMALPIHFDDYTVFKSPLEDFKQAVREAHLESIVTYLERGQTYAFSVNT
jgi:L-ascorbate metabolism protein UlaG (beta-lactamase superfamily)